MDERVPERDSHDERDEGGSELTGALHGEHCSHHGTTPARRRELGRDDSGQRVVTPNTDPHDHPPEDQQPGHANGPAGPGEGLDESCEDDDGELDAVHLPPAHLIGEPAEEELADDGAARRGGFEGGIDAGGEDAKVAANIRVEDGRALPEDHAKHGSDEIDGEDVIGIGEEADARDDDSADMVPRWRLVGCPFNDVRMVLCM